MPVEKQPYPAMVAKIRALTDRVHDLLRVVQDDGGPYETIQLKMPRAWMQLVERGGIEGPSGPASLPVLKLKDRELRKLAKRRVHAHTEEEMEWHLYFRGKR